MRVSRGNPRQADQFYSRDFNESVFQWAFQGAIRTMQGPLFPEARDASGALGSHCVLYVTYGQKGLNLRDTNHFAKVVSSRKILTRFGHLGLEAGICGCLIVPL